MNSHLKSVGRFFRVSILGLIYVGLGLAYAADSTSEVSLKDDQRSIEELRANIPPEVRAENDALKETLSLLGEVKLPPQKHREKFDRQMREIREKGRKARQKEREQFSKNERTKREKFLKEMKEARTAYMKRNVKSRDDRKEFFDNQDLKRKEYFDQERDARKEFDSTARQQESDANAFHREKTEEFRKELRSYTDRYNDWQKQMKQKEREAKEAAAKTK
jgi:hypothetical protein